MDQNALDAVSKELSVLFQRLCSHHLPTFGSISLSSWPQNVHREGIPAPASSHQDHAPPSPPKRERRFPRAAQTAFVESSNDSGDGGSEAPSTSGREAVAAPKKSNNRKRIADMQDEHHEQPDVVCVEVTKGRRRIYRARVAEHQEHDDTDGFDITDEKISRRNATREFLAGYLLPQGFPESVAPQYAPYMQWRACQYFFGGAMSVYTTRSLLSALGVGGRHKGEAAAAINWVVKDGAGRLGRFLFARWGRALDCELKQFRLIGDLLMECAAAMELATIAAPKAFLPLACTANLAKNLAAVAASSTRAPIYRTFAKQNNLADVTAKGESVANLADIAGTIFGITLTRSKLPIVPAFCLLSCGYLFASRKEVDSVELPYLNRARLSYSAQRYFSTGTVPSVQEANAHEPLLPWGASQRVVMGASVEDACHGPAELGDLLATWHNRQYALSYRPDTCKVYVVLREGATPADILEGAFHAQHLLHKLDGLGCSAGQSAPTVGHRVSTQALLQQVVQEGKELFQGFEQQAVDLGWKLQLTMLNPKETRLRVNVLQA